MPRQASSFAALVGLSLALPAALTSAPRLAGAQGPPPADSASAPQPPAAPPAGSAAPPAGSASADALDLTAPPPAATAADPNDNPYIPLHPVRRSGFVVGLDLGLGLIDASGTRQKFSLRGQKAEPGLATGGAGVLYIGGALTDWFLFRIGYDSTSATKGDLQIGGAGVLFGVNVWPLFWKGGIYQNLGVGLDFGTGGAGIVNKSDQFDVRAEGSGYSAIRFSLFYDVPLVKIFDLGPMLAYEHRSTDTYTEHTVGLGLRLLLHTGP